MRTKNSYNDILNVIRDYNIPTETGGLVMFTVRLLNNGDIEHSDFMCGTGQTVAEFLDNFGIDLDWEFADEVLERVFGDKA